MISVTQDGPVIRGQWTYNQFTVGVLSLSVPVTSTTHYFSSQLTFVLRPSDSHIHFTLSAGIPAIGIKVIASSLGHLNHGAITANFRNSFSLTEESGSMSGHVTVSQDAGYMRVHLLARGNYFREMDEVIDVLSLPTSSH